MSRELTDLTPSLQAAYMLAKDAFETINKGVYTVHLSCTFRSDAQQAIAYAKGRTAPGKIVTYNKPGKSKHNAYPSQAFDVYITNAKGAAVWDLLVYKSFAAELTVLSPFVKWGGSFKFGDACHFEL